MRKYAPLLMLSLLLAASPAHAANYAVDKAHTNIGFSVRHMVVSNAKGAFRDFTGSFSFDEKTLSLSSAELSIAAESIDTAEPKRDEHLRTPDFLDVKNHPKITFKLKEAKKLQGNRMRATGDLAIRGVTKEITLEGEFIGAANDPWGNRRAGFSAEGKINRQDFGLTWNKTLDTGGLVVGDEVRILIEVEGIMQK